MTLVWLVYGVPARQKRAGFRQQHDKHLEGTNVTVTILDCNKPTGVGLPNTALVINDTVGLAFFTAASIQFIRYTHIRNTKLLIYQH